MIRRNGACHVTRKIEIKRTENRFTELFVTAAVGRFAFHQPESVEKIPSGCGHQCFFNDWLTYRLQY